MKLAIVGLVALVLLGAASIAPELPGETPPGSPSTPAESAGLSESLPETAGESEAAPDSAASGISAPESLPAPDPGGDASESEEAPTDESGAGTELEEEPAETETAAGPAAVTLSDVFAVHLAGGQADSIMGFHGMRREPACARVAAVIALSDYTAATQDEAYFRVWEALNAALTAQANAGAAAASCTFADGNITIYI